MNSETVYFQSINHYIFVTITAILAQNVSSSVFLELTNGSAFEVYFVIMQHPSFAIPYFQLCFCSTKDFA